jgi:hypothetical protein
MSSAQIEMATGNVDCGQPGEGGAVPIKPFALLKSKWCLKLLIWT